MKRGHFIFLFVILLNSLNVFGLEPPSTLTFTLSIFDHHPSINTNFEPEGGSVTKGMVLNSLGSNKTPVLSNDATALDNGRIEDKSKFPYFFSYKEGENILISYDIKLNYDSKTATYKYENFNFFPIDGKGWDAITNPKYKRYYDGDTYHNYHFCAKLNSRFTFQGGEVFNFNGDDDVWVFIGGQLAVDLGGLHTNVSKNVYLDDLNLSVGTTYNFDFFYCERHTTKSNMKIETSIEVSCPKTDYCGVCLGSGADCCTPSKCVDAAKYPCRIYKCPSVDDTTVTPSNYLTKCTYTEKSCPAPNVCTNAACNATTGQCAQSNVVCQDKKSECLINPRCSTTEGGCKYDNICSNKMCSLSTCNKDGSGTCMPRNCTGSDPCQIYSCDETWGCQSKPKCPTPTNPCQQAVCSATGVCSVVDIVDCKACDCTGKLNACQYKTCNKAGECVPVDIVIEDGNACTTDKCNTTTGAITHELKSCGACQTCNSTTANCDVTLGNCEDGNICNVKSCAADGSCKYTPLSCDDGNACTTDSCDQFQGCVHTEITCPDENACKIGTCDPKSGCTVRQKECISEFFCIESACDDQAGCLFYDKKCIPDRPRCQAGVCNNETRECTSKDYDPMPFICKTAAVVSTSVIAGVTVAGAVAVGLAVFGGKKGYDYWKESRGNKISMANSNPLYEANANNGGENPLYNVHDH